MHLSASGVLQLHESTRGWTTALAIRCNNTTRHSHTSAFTSNHRDGSPLASKDDVCTFPAPLRSVWQLGAPTPLDLHRAALRRAVRQRGLGDLHRPDEPREEARRDPGVQLRAPARVRERAPEPGGHTREARDDRLALLRRRAPLRARVLTPLGPGGTGQSGWHGAAAKERRLRTLLPSRWALPCTCLSARVLT